MEKKIFRISIENKKGLLKKLDENSSLSQVRNLLNNNIDDKYFFSTEDYLIQKEDEKDYTLKEIASNGNQICLKLNSYTPKILIFLGENKIEEIKSSHDINIEELRKLSKNINKNDIFISNDGFEINQDEENEFSVNNIIEGDIIKIKRSQESQKDLNQENPKENEQEKILDKISVIQDKILIMDLNKVERNNNLAQIRILCGNIILKEQHFLFFENPIDIAKEEEILISNIIDKNNCIYIESNNSSENSEVKNIIKKENLQDKLRLINSLHFFFSNYINSPELKKEEIKDEYSYFNLKYKNFKGIKRFCIPIFGIINSGKSTLLNYLLNLNNILETGEIITTQFICIIRHNFGLKKPKIFSVKFEFRDDNFVNILKDKEIIGDIKDIVSEQNKIIEEKIKDNRRSRNPSDYFLIIEADIPFLNGLENDYSDLFEFLDYPGLNESSDNKMDIFYKDCLSLILPNVQFSLFIFDIEKYEGKESENIINNYKNFDQKFQVPYLQEICNESFNNSIFILNKIDLIDNDLDKEKHLKLLIKKYSLDEKNTLTFSAKLHLLERNKFESFIGE